MSEYNLPFELVVEIMNRVPVESLLRFRSVSKSCKSVIDSSHFINHYIGQKQHLLLLRHGVFIEPDRKYVSIVDDDHTFPQHKFSLTPPLLVKKLRYPIVIGCSQGLLCLYDVYLNPMHMAVIWNPSIRKEVAVMVPYIADDMIYRSALGFGVCSETNDPKIVKVTYICRREYMGSVSCIPRQVEVFTLSTGAWRSPYSSILPRKSIQFYFSSLVVVDRFLYWLSTDSTSEFTYYNLIISFDITSEEFIEVSLPDSLARNHAHYLSISKLRNSLVVLESDEVKISYDLWMMEDGVSVTFTKLFTICPPDAELVHVVAFRKSGEPVIEVKHIGTRHDYLSLALYEPESKHINNLGINGFFAVYAYMETLLLLDQPDSIIYGNMTPGFEA